MSDNLMRVQPIRNGTVLDHIKAGRGRKVLDALDLIDKGTTITLLMHVPSKKNSSKDVIKIEDRELSESESPKAMDFNSHNQISALLYWRELNLQIRLKAKIHKSSTTFSDNHFKKRSIEKNALSISSSQSKVISSYNAVEDLYNKTLSQINNQTKRPDYWGGFTFIPYYFEFWQGHENRLNKRHVFEQKNDEWVEKLLQP